MKLSTTFFSSALFVLFSAQIACGGADGAAAPDDESSEAELKKPRTVKFADFRSDADNIAEAMNVDDECTFSTSFAAGALTLTVKEGKTSTKIVASPSDAIMLTEKAGGMTRIYKIGRVGTLTLIQADDAFVSATILSSSTKKTSSCEIDF